MQVMQRSQGGFKLCLPQHSKAVYNCLFEYICQENLLLSMESICGHQ